jgi:hypothetical protein
VTEATHDLGRVGFGAGVAGAPRYSLVRILLDFIATGHGDQAKLQVVCSCGFRRNPASGQPFRSNPATCSDESGHPLEGGSRGHAGVR